MILKLKKKWLDHEAGSVVDTADETGRLLIQQGIAEPYKAVKVIEQPEVKQKTNKILK